MIIVYWWSLLAHIQFAAPLPGRRLHTISRYQSLALELCGLGSLETHPFVQPLSVRSVAWEALKLNHSISLWSYTFRLAIPLVTSCIALTAWDAFELNPFRWVLPPPTISMGHASVYSFAVVSFVGRLSIFALSRC